MIHHLVVVKFKPGTPQATVSGLFAALARLPQVIPGILHYAGGPYASPEGLNQGFTHGFVMTFRDAAARDAYVAHPDHERFKSGVLPSIETITIFDFEV